jgi:5'-3' exonuclease
MTTALIDGDIICYRCAASCQKQGVTVEPLEVAIMRVDELMQRILHETGAEFYYPYLTGSDNFRTYHNPEYKANRKDTPRPEYLQQCREHLVVKWNAQVSDGCEADDLMAIEQTKNPDETIICTIDKDLLQVTGKHYNFVKQEFRTISPIEGRFNFYWQFIMGDKSDNIFGFDGIARQTIPKKLEGMQHEMQELASDELAIFNYVRELYNDDDRLLMNGRCLWMQRYPDELWEFPIGKT